MLLKRINGKFLNESIYNEKTDEYSIYFRLEERYGSYLTTLKCQSIYIISKCRVIECNVAMKCLDGITNNINVRMIGVSLQMKMFQLRDCSTLNSVVFGLNYCNHTIDQK